MQAESAAVALSEREQQKISIQLARAGGDGIDPEKPASRCKDLTGADCRTRTCDPLITNQVLYQLS